MVLARPLQARAQKTRAKLIASTARCLASRGFAGASTQAVADAAGCSQGALFKHFPTKAELLAASIETLLARFVADFRDGVTQRLPAGLSPEMRIRTAVEALWKIFKRREMQAVFEVFVVARTEAPLARALGPILDRHRARILAEARLLFPEAAALPNFENAVDAVVYAMQGVALGVFAPDEKAEEQQLAFFHRLAIHELQVI
jgi:AcrR family transcriptional regulator